MPSFDIATEKLAWIPVPVPGFESTGEQVGKNVTYDVDMKVVIVDRDRFRELFVPADPEKEPERAAEQAKRTDFELFKELCRDWRGVVSNKIPIDFNDDTLRAAIKMPNFPEAFGEAYYQAWQGRAKIRLGNSNGSAQNGQASAAEPE